MNEEKETVGKIAVELRDKEAPTQDPIELEREMHKDYEKNVFEAIERGKKEHDSNFYVVVITKRERLLENIIRNYFTTRLSCPTPEWDQTVYLYERSPERIILLWVIPSKEACSYLQQYATQVDPSEHDLLRYVIQFHDGTLLKFSKKLNGEQEKSPLLDK